MNRTRLLRLAPSLLLAACAGYAPDRPPLPAGGSDPVPGASNTTAPAALPAHRPGVGVVESASVVSLSSSPPAAAGGTARASSSPTMGYRLKMDDGSMQSILSGERFEVGDRVEVTADGRLARR